MHKRPLYTVLFILALSFAKEGRCSVVVAADNPKEGFLLAEKKQTKFQDAAVHRTAASRRVWGEVWKRYRVFPGTYPDKPAQRCLAYQVYLISERTKNSRIQVLSEGKGRETDDWL